MTGMGHSAKSKRSGRTGRFVTDQNDLCLAILAKAG